MKVPVERADALTDKWLEAYILVYHVAKVRPGEKVLILSSFSGIGVMLLQLCNRIGAEVIAVVDGHESMDLYREMGKC